jgi:hypothetical protein
MTCPNQHNRLQHESGEVGQWVLSVSPAGLPSPPAFQASASRRARRRGGVSAALKGAQVCRFEYVHPARQDDVSLGKPGSGQMASLVPSPAVIFPLPRLAAVTKGTPSDP